MDFRFVRDRLERSTAHGISHAAIAREPAMTCFWMFFFILASCAFGYYFNANLQKFLSEPTSVTIQESGAKFIPPDVHLCNLNPLARSRLLDPWTIENSSVVQSLLEHMANLEQTTEKYAPDIPKGSIFWSSIPKDKLFAGLGHLRQQTILFAEIGLDSSLDQSSFEHTTNFNYFTCFRATKDDLREFNSTASSLNMRLYTDSFHFNKTPIKFDGYSLSKFNFLGQPTVTAPSGILVIFTPPGEYPHLESHSVLLSPGRYTNIKLRMKKSKQANTKHDPCVENKESITYYNPLFGPNSKTDYVKSLSDCKYRKIVERLLREREDCQCLPHMVPVTRELAERYPVCANFSNAVDSKTALIIEKQVYCSDYYYFYEAEFDLDECNGERPCETLTYSSEVSTTEWPLLDDIESVIQEFKTDIIQTNLDPQDAPGLTEYLADIQQNSSQRNEMTKYNFARASIRAAEAKSLQVTENVSYGLENWISDIGGVAGLFLGMSFLTILEIFDLLYDFIEAKRNQRLMSEKEMAS